MVFKPNRYFLMVIALSLLTVWANAQSSNDTTTDETETTAVTGTNTTSAAIIFYQQQSLLPFIAMLASISVGLYLLGNHWSKRWHLIENSLSLFFTLHSFHGNSLFIHFSTNSIFSFSYETLRFRKNKTKFQLIHVSHYVSELSIVVTRLCFDWWCHLIQL